MFLPDNNLGYLVGGCCNYFSVRTPLKINMKLKDCGRSLKSFYLFFYKILYFP